MILLPCLNRLAAKTLPKAAIAFLEEQGNPADILVNSVLEAVADGRFTLYGLPEA